MKKILCDNKIVNVNVHEMQLKGKVQNLLDILFKWFYVLGWEVEYLGIHMLEGGNI